MNIKRGNYGKANTYISERYTLFAHLFTFMLISAGHIYCVFNRKCSTGGRIVWKRVSLYSVM